MLWKRKGWRDPEIAPDEIFLDAANAPDFDTSRFEGRLERPLAPSAFLGVSITIILAGFVLLAQTWNLQVNQGAAYAAQSQRNSLDERPLFAERGIILDDQGTPLVTNELTNDGFVRRVYKTPGFGALLGYVSYPKKDANGNFYETEMKGMAGIELAYNNQLAGTNGSLLVETDATGKITSQGSIKPPVNGTSLTLSIDARVQQAFFDAIKGLADKVPFEGGSGILMDVETGELRAYVSYPEYDPNVLSAGAPKDVIRGYSTDSRRPYLNRPVQGLYTPGSVVKPLEAAGAVTDGAIDPNYTVNAQGSLSLPNPYNPSKPNIFKDWKVLGVIDLRDAIAWSSDVYFYMVGGGYGNVKGLGIKRLAYWYDTFGLTSPTGLGLQGEKSGFVPTPEWKQETFGEAWNIGNTYHTAIGQYSMQVTPLAQARAIAAIANGGYLVKPTLVHGAPITKTQLPLSTQAIKVVQEGMRMGVTEGTSIGLNDLSFVEPAGKTGTAQQGVRNEFHTSWAVGFWPYDHPKYVYTVIMERGPASNVLGGIYVMHQVLTTMRHSAPEYFE